MIVKNSNGSDPDFVQLCAQLDDYLNCIAGGAQKRKKYIPYNQPNSIQHTVILYDMDTPVGCIGLRHYEKGVAELKRLYILETYRGQGLSKLLMEEIEKLAITLEYHDLILETGAVLHAAMALFHHMGYYQIPNYGPYASMRHSVCMAKTLVH